MFADGAKFRSSRAQNEMSAIPALPKSDAGFLEDFLRLNIFQQLAITFLVMFFNRRNASELFGEFVEAFLISLTSHARIHVRPLEIFTFRRMKKIFFQTAQLTESLEPKFCMFLFIFGSLEEECGNLFATVFLGDGSIIGVFIARLRFSREGLTKIFFSFGAG